MHALLSLQSVIGLPLAGRRLCGMLHLRLCSRPPLVHVSTTAHRAEGGVRLVFSWFMFSTLLPKTEEKRELWVCLGLARFNGRVERLQRPTPRRGFFSVSPASVGAMSFAASRLLRATTATGKGVRAAKQSNRDLVGRHPPMLHGALLVWGGVCCPCPCPCP